MLVQNIDFLYQSGADVSLSVWHTDMRCSSRFLHVHMSSIEQHRRCKSFAEEMQVSTVTDRQNWEAGRQKYTFDKQCNMKH